MKLHRCRLEFKAEDLWVGVHWRHTYIFTNDRADADGKFTDIWICLLPCLPIHLTFVRGI